MNKIYNEILLANQDYSKTFDKSSLTLPPVRKIAILTCMDARLDPAKFAGLQEGDAHIIRNAGGRASDDAIRSLVISHKLLGTSHWFVIHHTDCGMELFTNDIMANLLDKSLDTSSFGPSGWTDQGSTKGPQEGHYINWLTIKNQTQSIVEDVKRIKNHPLVPQYIPVWGFIYDVKTGKLIEVAKATEEGKVH